MNSELLRLALAAMDDLQFEDLVYALVRVDEPTARQLKPPDAGRDTIVPATKGHGERAWQAKHHTAAINWSKCRESLTDALGKRKPVEVTFVFPVNMTEGKESGLDELRNDFPQVQLPEPWTFGTLREKLAEHPEIRRAHIDDNIIGIDREFAREMFERGAQVREGWDEQTAAALEGPLSVLGQEEEVKAAQAAYDEQRWGEAADGLERAALAIADRAPAIADVLLMQAAGIAGEHGDRARAGRLHLRVSRTAAARGDDAAEYAAFRASWELPEAEQWRSFAATARAAWPERPEEALPVLHDALARSLANDDTDAIAEWADGICEALASEDDWEAVRDAASSAIARLGPVTAAGPRLELELEWLTARSELGEDVDHEFAMLLLAPLGHEDAVAGRIDARWAFALVRSGRATDGALRFREAAQRWRAAADGEDELAEAIFSEDAVARLAGVGRRLGQAQRIAAADLRGRVQSPAVLADRKEHEALRTWLAGRAYDARRALTIAWSTHRRAGHFGGCMRLGVELAEMFKAAEEWPAALAWAMRTGNVGEARTIAANLSWPQIREAVRAKRPSWERAPAWEAVAVTGLLAPDADAAALTDELLDAAADHNTSVHQLPPAASAARRALSTLLCALPDDRLTQAVDEVVFEIEHTPFPPDQAMQGLLYAIEADICDRVELVAEVFGEYDRSHVGGFQTATSLIRRSAAASGLLAELAMRGFTALVTATWCDLPDHRPELAQRAADVAARGLAGTLTPEEILRRNDHGQLARWADEDVQRELASVLIGTLADAEQIDLHRFEAGEGLAKLAGRMESHQASAALDRLFAAAHEIETPSERQSSRSHSNPRFARWAFSTPVTPGAVDSIALRAAVELAGRCDRLNELRESVRDGIENPLAWVRCEALRLSALWRTLPAPDFRSFLTDDDDRVRAWALKGLDAAGMLRAGDPALDECAAATQPLSVRVAAVGVARNAPHDHDQALRTLSEDSFSPVRATARRALTA